MINEPLQKEEPPPPRAALGKLYGDQLTPQQRDDLGVPEHGVRKVQGPVPWIGALTRVKRVGRRPVLHQRPPRVHGRAALEHGVRVQHRLHLERRSVPVHLPVRPVEQQHPLRQSHGQLVLGTRRSSSSTPSRPAPEKLTRPLNGSSVAKNQKQQIEDDIQKLVDIEQKILDYDLYLMALSKDGVPYELISKAIPSIEREINNVLENMNAGFHIELEMKDKMIDAFICYGEDKWNLELSSGMERFVSSLAIRIGLINVSTLPRPNFIIVDEGFGALDSDNIANMQGAFQYLRTQFDFTMIITHLDTIKDYMDTLIPINVNNGLSKVVMN